MKRNRWTGLAATLAMVALTCLVLGPVPMLVPVAGHKHKPQPTPTPVPTPTSTPTPTPNPTPLPFPGGTSDESVTLQNDYGHDGAQPGDQLTPPLFQRWSVDLGGDVSYPLIAGGRVFAVANHQGGSTGARLFALDAATGAVDWSADLGTTSMGTSYGADLAYDAGRVFATNATDKRVRAFDAATGALVWTSPTPANPVEPVTAPTAVAGVVYYQQGDNMFAVRESDGSLIWTANPHPNSQADGPVAVDASSLYEAYPCAGAYSWATATGTLGWKYEPCYGGGGGSTPALHDEKLYVRGTGNPILDTPTVYDGASGNVLGQFTAQTPEAFDGDTGFFLDAGGSLSAVNLTSNGTDWTFTGDGALRSNVLVANGFVYVGSGSGTVYALAESSGQQVWSGNAGAPLLWTDEVEIGGPPTAMAIGEGLLAVPASNLLTVYASCGSGCPAPGGVSVVDPGPQSSFWFAAGSTASGSDEQLQLYSPHASGPATIDYFTGGGKTSTTVQLSAGMPTAVDVGSVVGPGRQVSAHVQLPGPGVAERVLHFPAGGQQASSDRTGVVAPSVSWGFVAGSTASTTDEYLALLNPSTASVTVSLVYFTDVGSTIKTLSLAPQTPTTVEVFSGDPAANVSSCIPSGSGANCGVGRGIAGVSVLVTAQNSAQIVAERVLSLNGYDFGSGPISGGDTAFGTSGQGFYYFAAGNTQSGFGQHLVLLNPTNNQVAQDVTYFADGTGMQKTITLPANSRHDIDLSDPNEGVGPGHATVSAVINSVYGVYAERETYVAHDFGSGMVTGLQTSFGATTGTDVSGFSAGSTLPGDASFLTIFAAAGSGLTPGGRAVVTLTLDAGAGPVRRTFTIPVNGTAVVPLADPNLGIGPGQAQVGVVVTGSGPAGSAGGTGIVVEKTTYSANASTYGTTDTMPAWPAMTGSGIYAYALEFF